MIFNSFSFLVFFIFVISLYIFLSHRLQNRFLLAASYFFYAAWDYRFCLLLLTTTLIDYISGSLIYRFDNHRKIFLIASVCSNLAILGFFKYFNFFAESFLVLLTLLGLKVNPFFLQIILPVGISFYTFQSMSYVIDIYKKEIEPITSFFDYALYVSFFPQLVAGPIERAQHLLPQIISPRTVSFAGIQRGFYYIFCGFFLKIYVADNLARLVDPIFNATTSQSGFHYLLAGYGFAFQIFGDFAGYSYVARGIGSILGFDIINNFNLPYFSKNPQEFWRRWHISLSTWLRDYLYIPLGGNRLSSAKTVRNLMITMLLGGLWHGAKITFVLWGGIHGILLIAYHLIGLYRGTTTKHTHRSAGWLIKKWLKILVFFHIIVFTWYFFRANSLDQLQTIFLSIIFNFNYNGDLDLLFKLGYYILPVILFQLLQYISNDTHIIFRFPIIVRASVYLAAFYLIVIFGVNHAQDFIYFQF